MEWESKYFHFLRDVISTVLCVTRGRENVKFSNFVYVIRTSPNIYSLYKMSLELFYL
jgi:hypothetical protein